MMAHVINLETMLNCQILKQLRIGCKYIKSRDLFIHCLSKPGYIDVDLVWKVVEMEWGGKCSGEIANDIFYIYRSSNDAHSDSSVKENQGLPDNSFSHQFLTRNREKKCSLALFCGFLIFWDPSRQNSHRV